jgi:hypothetical protein
MQYSLRLDFFFLKQALSLYLLSSIFLNQVGSSFTASDVTFIGASMCLSFSGATVVVTNSQFLECAAYGMNGTSTGLQVTNSKYVRDKGGEEGRRRGGREGRRKVEGSPQTK